MKITRFRVCFCLLGGKTLKKILLAAVASMAIAASANAASVVYVTGSDPWGNTSNDATMDAAFGAGNWTKVIGFGDSVFTAGHSFIFMDGSDGNGSAFSSYFNGTGAAAAQAYVTGGGHLFVNAAYNGGASLTNLGFGATSTYWGGSGSVQITAAGVTAGLDAGLSTINLTGNSFSHNSVAGPGFTTLISGDGGPVLAAGNFGAGYYMIGGQTTINWHSPGGTNPAGDAFKLRVNELKLASGVGNVPEPAAWAMMLAGFGLVGSAMRRREKVAVTFA